MAENAMFKERLAHYEAVEKELDEAIMATAEGTEIQNDVIGAIAGAPTSSRRRIQQSIALASRVQAKQKEIDKLKSEKQALLKKI